ncbi:hypothetical protein DRO35_02440 [Candidatus Bathyarchaeota archaeon]|nr:MAG: hypothetical protein DRO35_02440 [Candidatus Bathyarchaeota archaeon]
MILVSACVLIRTSHGKFKEAVERIQQIKGVARVFPVLGRYDAVADVECPSISELGSTVVRISRLAGVVFTETLVEVQKQE